MRILAQAMATDRPDTFEKRSMIELVGFSMDRDASRQVYEAAGVGPDDIDVCELHDCFAQNELICYEALGFCPEGGAEKFVDEGDNTYGGKVVVNPSGGLLSKGHPLGATGLAQCYELTRQIRGDAGPRRWKGPGSVYSSTSGSAAPRRNALRRPLMHKIATLENYRASWMTRACASSIMARSSMEWVLPAGRTAGRWQSWKTA